MLYGGFAVWFCCPVLHLDPQRIAALVMCDSKFDFTDLSDGNIKKQVKNLNACLSMDAAYAIKQSPGDQVNIPLGVLHSVSSHQFSACKLLCINMLSL